MDSFQYILFIGILDLSLLYARRQDSSIGFGAPVRANMRSGGLTNAVVTSSLLESVRTNFYMPTHNKFEHCIHIFFLFQADSGDLVAYGLIPEFIGRFPILVSSSALDEDQLLKVC